MFASDMLVLGIIDQNDKFFHGKSGISKSLDIYGSHMFHVTELSRSSCCSVSGLASPYLEWLSFAVTLLICSKWN